MSDLIDVAETLELLERAVAEKGVDYVYPGDEDHRDFDAPYDGSCRYTVRSTGAPACIVGHVLAYRSLLHIASEGTAASCLPGIEHHFTDRAIDALGAAQSAQDNGKPWGAALERAQS